jgi:hypothetical protein
LWHILGTNVAEYLLDQTGQVVKIDSSESAEALKQSGFVPANSAQVESAQKQEKYGGLVGGLEAGAAGLARGVSLGLSDWAAKNLNITDEKTLQTLKDMWPIVSGTSEVAGIAIPALLSGGAGAAGAMARATPAGLASLAGRAATKFTAKTLPAATSVPTALLQKTLSSFVGNAVEGAFWGAGNEVSEATLQNRPLIAQGLLEHAGYTGLLTGGIGAALSFAGTGLSAAIKKARGSFSPLNTGMSQQALDAYAALIERYRGIPQDVTKEIFKNKESLLALRKASPGLAEMLETLQSPEDVAKFLNPNTGWAALRDPKFQKKLVDGFRDAVNAAYEGSQDLWAQFPQWRAQEFGAYLKAQPRTQLLQAARDFAERATPMYEFMTNNQSIYGTSASAKVARSIQEFTDFINGKILDARTGVRQLPTNYEIWERMNDLRDKLWNWTKARSFWATDPGSEEVRNFVRGISGKTQVPSDTFLREMAAQGKPLAHAAGHPMFPNGRPWMPMWQDLTSMLQDPLVVGADAATRQTSINAAQHEWMKWMEYVEKNYMSEFPNAKYDFVADPAKIKSFVRNLAEDSTLLGQEAFTNFKNAASGLADQMEITAGKVGAKFDKTALTDLFAAQSDQIQAARHAAEVEKIGEQLKAQTTITPPQMSGAGAQAAQGFERFGIAELAKKGLNAAVPGLGSAATIVTGAKAFADAAAGLKHPTEVAAKLAQMHKLGQTVLTKSQAASQALAINSTTLGRVARSEAAAGIARSYGLSNASSERQYKDRVELLQRMQDPAQMQDMLLSIQEHLGDTTPEIAQNLIMTMIHATAYLQQQIPQPPSDGGLVKREWKPSRAQISEFNRAYDAVERPLSLIKEAALGTLSPKSVAALQAAAPELLQQMQSDVLLAITNSKGKIPYRTKLGASVLLGQPVDNTVTGTALLNRLAFGAPKNLIKDTTGRQLHAGFSGMPGVNPQPSMKGMRQLHVQSRIQTPMQRANQRAQK